MQMQRRTMPNFAHIMRQKRRTELNCFGRRFCMHIIQATEFDTCKMQRLNLAEYGVSKSVSIAKLF